MAPLLRRNLGAHRKTQSRGDMQEGNFSVPPLSDHPIQSVSLLSLSYAITPRLPPRPPAAGDTEGCGRGKASRPRPLISPSPSPQCPSQTSCVPSERLLWGFDRSRAHTGHTQRSKDLPVQLGGLGCGAGSRISRMTRARPQSRSTLGRLLGRAHLPPVGVAQDPHRPSLPANRGPPA